MILSGSCAFTCASAFAVFSSQALENIGYLAEQLVVLFLVVDEHVLEHRVDLTGSLADDKELERHIGDEHVAFHRPRRLLAFLHGSDYLLEELALELALHRLLADLE